MSSERNAASPFELWLYGLPPSLRERARQWWEFSESTGRLQTRWPTEQHPLVSAWLGSRWYYLSEPPPAGRTVAIGSSRWGRRPEHWIPLAQRLQAALTDLPPRNNVLITAADTTCDRLIRRWAETQSLPWIELMIPPARWDWYRWCDFLFATYGRQAPDRPVARSADGLPNGEHAAVASEGSRRIVIHVSPPWPPQPLSSPGAELPLRDVLLAAAADEWRVIYQRPRGAIAQVTQARRDQQGLHPGLTTMTDVAPHRPHDGQADRPRRSLRRTIEVSADAAPPEGEFLLHWTRACSGRWPDQTDEAFLDELLSGQIASRSARDVLERIVATEMLYGTGAAIRGGYSMVCFTELSLAELMPRRTYRPHRQRWDAEPFGLAISRSWLLDRGARPVCYGDDSTWQQLAESDRPYFQFADSPLGAARPIDWTAEREWRVTGPLDLSSLPGDAAWVWVPDQSAAERLYPLSRWPVVTVQQPLSEPSRESS